jgi:hypothetical protein
VGRLPAETGGKPATPEMVKAGKAAGAERVEAWPSCRRINPLQARLFIFQITLGDETTIILSAKGGKENEKESSLGIDDGNYYDHGQ